MIVKCCKAKYVPQYIVSTVPTYVLHVFSSIKCSLNKEIRTFQEKLLYTRLRNLIETIQGYVI